MKITAISISRERGVKKENVSQALFEPGHGIQGDAHAGDWHRQVSALAQESIEKMRATLAQRRAQGRVEARDIDLAPGDFAENLTTSGLDLASLPIGQRLRLGASVVLELTQIGKECHSGCAIAKAVGRCAMPEEGVFFRVISGGLARPGDRVELIG